ncbi:MAG: hypothetical protein WCD82_24935, partial [Xanthobacteraceae bacterium]
TLYCTTFPCHLCAKHIVAAGIERVVFLEPYPKSYAQKLHSDSITFETNVGDKVLFEPFIGISPRRYRDIFEKKKRKGEDGKAKHCTKKRPRRWSKIEVPPISKMKNLPHMWRSNDYEVAHLGGKNAKLLSH